MHELQILSRVSMSVHAERDILLQILSIRLSVCPSVCRSNAGNVETNIHCESNKNTHANYSA